MNLIKQFNLLVSFLLEVGLVVLAGYWGFHQSESSILNYILAIGVPTVIILLWGAWAAPKSKRRLKNPVRTIFKLAMMAFAVFFAYATRHPVWALSFAIITILNVSLAYLWAQDY